MSSNSPERIGVFNHGLRRLDRLEAFLDGTVVRCLLRTPPDLTATAGWGRRKYAERARRVAARRDIPFLCLEDGFLRSSGLAGKGYPPLSLVVDRLGIYYDAFRPSELEAIIRASDFDTATLAEARRAIALIRAERLSKYNHAPDLDPDLLPAGPKILVIDQTAGDMSLVGGGVTAATFTAMLDAALAEHPEATVIVKTHPDVIAGKKTGHYSRLHGRQRVMLLGADVSPLSLLEHVEGVYVATSQMGFEALLLGKPVVCFGLPWYAGWGCTDDRHPQIDALRSRRPQPRSVEELFAAAYLRYARYLDPASGERGTIFDVIRHLTLNRRLAAETQGTLFCIGMSLWKRAVIIPFLKCPGNRLRFVRSPATLTRQALPADARIVVWGKGSAEIQAFAQQRQLPLWHMEDGFLRSVGLGSDLRAPLSLVLDPGGLYYDPHSASALESWLNHQQPEPAERARAVALRELLVTRQISKYNIGSAFALPAQAHGRRTLLVPGQVEDDASIRFGAPVIGTNLALLETVRRNHPEAWIIYKPHPDVVAGNRRGAIPEPLLARLADQTTTSANISTCLAAVDEVHTMTSLAGFEALLLGKTVHCYGGPFYAGWGLTIDHYPLPQRRRRLDLDTLVYGVLIAYPRYTLPHVAGFVAAEAVAAHLASATSRSASAGAPNAGWLARQYRKLCGLARALRLLMQHN